MNSYELKKCLEYFYRGNVKTVDIQVLNLSQVESLQIKKKYSLVVVFIPGHPTEKNLGHFVCFNILKKKGKVIRCEFFDTFNKPVNFYFENFPLSSICNDHPVFQGDNDNDCALQVLYYGCLRRGFTYESALNHIDNLTEDFRSRVILFNYQNIVDNVNLRPQREELMYPRVKKYVLGYLENVKNNGQLGVTKSA